MAKWTLDFCENGGYDCMTDSWDIRKDGTLVVSIDQADFGQQPCQNNGEQIEEAKRAAEICYQALMNRF